MSLKAQRDRNLYDDISVFSKVNTTINRTLFLNQNSLTDISLQLLQQVLVKYNSRYKQVNSQTEFMRKHLIKTLRRPKNISKVLFEKELAGFLFLFSLNNETFMKVCENSKEPCKQLFFQPQ